MLPAADEADELQQHDQRAGRGLGKGEAAHHLRMRKPAVGLDGLLRDIGQHGVGSAEGHERGFAKEEPLLRLRAAPAEPCGDGEDGNPPKREADAEALAELKASAKAKLIAGEALTDEEASAIVI